MDEKTSGGLAGRRVGGWAGRRADGWTPFKLDGTTSKCSHGDQ